METVIALFLACFVSPSCSVQDLVVLVESGGQGSDMARQFLTMLAVCHTVIPDRDESRPDSSIIYHAASPGKLSDASHSNYNTQTSEHQNTQFLFYIF